MKLYKLTDKDMRTHNRCQWVLGVPSPMLSGEGDLCGPGWYHVYTDPLLAVLFDPIHANYGPDARLFEGEGDIGLDDHGVKVGTRQYTPLKEIPKPEVNTTQRVAFGILAALEVYDDADYHQWAKDWLSGRDRSGPESMAAEEVADAAAWAAWVSWAIKTAEAARAAARAAEAAGRAAEAAARAVRAAWAVEKAADAAAWAAMWAAGAAEAAIDLPALARRAMEVRGEIP